MCGWVNGWVAGWPGGWVAGFATWTDRHVGGWLDGGLGVGGRGWGGDTAGADAGVGLGVAMCRGSNDAQTAMVSAALCPALPPGAL